MLTFENLTDSSPLFISVPHAGEEIPPECKSTLVDHPSAFYKKDCDLYVDQIWSPACQKQKVSFLASSVSRVVVDLNRDRHDLDGHFVKGLPLSEKQKYLSLVPFKNTYGEPLLKEPLTASHLEKRLLDYYDPFHEILEKSLIGIKNKKGYVLHVDAHSMPSKGKEGHNDSGTQRTDIVLGDCFGDSCCSEFTNLIQSHFEEHGFTVSVNEPYSGKGGFISRHYGAPQKGIHSILLELNRKLYMNEESFKIDPEGMKRCQSIVGSLIEKLKKFDPRL